MTHNTSHSPWFGPLAALIGYLLAISPSSASNIQSHPDASGENRPVVGESANGIPVVDITSPGEDGVSHNVYQQLDVDKAGVVFNNGRRVSTSKLAGQIGANPALAGGTADLILNEVRAASPSQLAGYLEIGGDAADLVIANPAGITCNGCGFINAERAMLTTGRPSFDNERWTGLEVRDGRIRIEGDGMDASRTAEADLLARAVEINAGIWADDLDVTAGAGHYDRFGRLIGPINTDTSSPQWGIDTARLGGMYAGKIRLVANEHGVGVRNAGDVAAGPNGLSITADGKLVNSGTTTAAGTTALRAEGITNTGAIHAERRLSLDGVNTLDNREGRIAGQADITTDAGVIDNRDGEILAGDALTLTLDTSLRNGAGLLYGRHNLTLSTPLMTGEGLWLSDGDIKATIRGNHRHQGEIAAGRNLSLTVEGTLDNADRLTAAGQAGIEADEVNNLASSEITAGALEITAESDLENHGLIDGHEIRVAATTIENSADGRIYGDQLSVTAHHLLNLGNEGSAATLAARSQLRLATDELKNRNEALILSAGDMLIEGHDKAFVDHLLNEGASIEALGDLSITAGHIDNRNGGLVTAQVDEPTVYRQFVQPKGSHHRYPRSECHGIGGGQDDNYCNGYPGSFEDYTLFQFNETTSRTKVTKTDPATIRSGGDLHLTGGELMNEDSHVIAGGDLLADLDDLDNRATRGQDITRRVGTSRFTTVESCGLFGSDHCREWHGTSSYRPAPEYGTPYDLPTVTYIDKESTNPALSTIPGAAGTSPSKNPTLPKASLFHIQRGNPNTPLIETDPRFASYRHWYGSEAMLDALARDPAYTQKRLGDGFYEQSIVRQQIVEETGQRHLDGFADDEAQFRALIDAGISFGRDLDLAPGVHLSAEQLAQLTADIVWLEEETVAVDGKARQVLVPHLHLADEPTHLGGRQGLIAGMNLNLTVAGTATNRGNLAASDTLALSANRIENLGGKIRAGRTRLTAGTDIRQRGGTIRGQQALSLAAGRDITLEADTRKGENRVDASDFTRDHVVDRGRLGVTGNGSALSVAAGRDIRLQAAEITHSGEGGSTTLAAGRDIELATATESQDEHIVWDPDNRLVQGNSREIGATIDTEGNLELIAGRDLDARAANLDSASGDVAIAAGNNIRLEAGRATSHWEEAHRIEDDGFLSSKVSTSLDSSTTDRAIASTVGGDRVTLATGGDLSIQGSHVISDRGTQVGAGGDVQLLADRDEQTRYHFHQKSRSGLFSNGGLSVTLGDQRISATDDLARQTAAPSNLASIDGDVAVRAGETYRQTGSDVLAPGGDVDIRAGRVEITEARETATSRHQREMEQSGLAVSLSSPVIDAGRSIQRMASAADRTDSGRMKALAAASAGLAGMDAYNRIDTGLALENGNVAQKAGGLEVSLSLGSSESSQAIHSHRESTRGSVVASGGNARLVAQGMDDQSDVLLRGSEISAGENADIRAQDAIRIEAARHDMLRQEHQDGSGSRIGIGFAIGGQQNGFSLEVGAHRMEGEGELNATQYKHSRLRAGETASLSSGGNTMLRGARVEGQTARIDSRGNLVIENVQDVSRYDSDRREAGAALSLCIPPFCYGASSASLNLGEASIESDYASVTETAGIEAGDGGFDVRVAGDTDLAGGVIASSQGAVDAGRNHFETGGELRLADLENRAQYEGESYGVTVGLGADIADSNAGVGEDAGRADSATRAGISGIAGHRGVRSGDDSGAIDPIFDAERVHDEIRAQVSITREFGQRAGATVRQWSATRRHALREAEENATTDDRRKAIQDEIRQVNLEERVMNVLVGAVTGQLDRAAGKEALSAAAEEMRRISIENSSRFPGVTDGETTLTNLSGESVGVRGDGIKLGGTRGDLDTLCGPGYMRCKTQTDTNGEPILDKNGMPKLDLNSEGALQWTARDENNRSIPLAEFLESPEGRDMAGLTGGIQGWKGTLFGLPYAPGSWQDQLIEAFAGSHDFIGGQLSGLYDEQGNIRQGMEPVEKFSHDRWSEAAIPLAAPFAAAELLPPEVWNGISIILENAQ